MRPAGTLTELNSRRLWSLWEMLEKHALLFTSATSKLTEAKWLCAPFRLREGESGLNRVQVSAVIFTSLAELRRACILSDMQEMLPEVDRLEEFIKRFIPTSQEHPFEPLAISVKHLVSRIIDELNTQYYFHLDQRDVSFYLTERPFGDAVVSKFPKATEDISEAGKCLAMQRPTACVFHLMRVLELGVQTLGKKVKVKINVHTETWHQILLHVNKAVLALPSKTPRQKAKKSRYAVASAHLESVRLAWRNEVMHPKQTYTREEARNVYNACSVFMAYLAELV